LFPPHASVFLPSFGQFCSGEDAFERGGRKTNEPVSWYFMYYEIWWEGKIRKKNIRLKRIFGGLKAYLRATDHTSSNIISREVCN
jgi:hypothetical protein